ncbi:MAG TPA: hypothetical protein VE008_02440 [Burkholderiales bacterium]|nr:hypothetical protein [Burkholderiales bacterium]
MDKQELIDRLRELEGIPELEVGFDSQEDAVRWAAEVAPLLRFDGGYHGEFRQRAQTLSMNLSGYTQGPNLHRMTAILHEAIADLEAGVGPEVHAVVEAQPQPNAGLEVPQHLTLAWLWNYVPWAVWVSLAAALCVVFVAGITFGRSDLYERLMTPHTTTPSGPGKAESTK